MEPDRAFQLDHGLPRAPGQAQDLCEVLERACVKVEEVGSPGQLDRLARKVLGVLEIAPLREQLRLHAPPGDLRVEVVRQRRLGHAFRQRHGLVCLPLEVEHVREQRRHRGEMAEVTPALEQADGDTQRTLGGGGPAGEQLDLRGIGLNPGGGDLEAQLVRERQR